MKKVVRGIDTVSSCYECFTKLSKGQNFYLFDDFGEIPDCVKSLKSYNEYRQLAIGWLFCSTFKPPGYIPICTVLVVFGLINTPVLSEVWLTF